MKRLCLVLIPVALLCAVPALACGPYVPTVVVRKVIVETPVVATFVPLVVAVPAYGASFTPAVPVAPPPVAQVAPPVQTAWEQKFNLLLQRMDGLEKRLASPKPMDRAEPQSVLPNSPALAALFTADCKRCHDATTAGGKEGGKLVLLDNGQVPPLTDRDLRKIQSNIFLGKMPKDGPLKDERVGQYMEALDAYAAKK